MKELVDVTPKVAHLYVDGGVIGRNPSAIGGTYACVLLDAGGVLIGKKSGYVLTSTAGVPAVTNNYTELLAALEGLKLLPDGWDGTLYTDSNVTRCRLVNERPGFAGIPGGMVSRVWMERRRAGAFKVVLLDGHPTKLQLARGIGKRGNPVSKWNVVCDEDCQKVGRDVVAAMAYGQSV